MALLLDERRSATAQVAIDADLLVLCRQDLDRLSLHSSIAVVMTRELGRRLVRSNRDREEREQFNVVAAMGSTIPTLARNPAQVTGETVCLFDLGGLANVTLYPSVLAQDNLVLARDAHPFGPAELPERRSSLVEQNNGVLFCIAPYETPHTLRAMELADITVQIGAEEHAWSRRIAAKRLWRGDSSETSVRRMACQIAQRLVGLALSSGNARGVAHFGVLKVLQEETIPIDRIAGTSAGTTFGSMFAAGRSVPELIEFAVNVQRKYNSFIGFRYWDIRMPLRSGLIKGNLVLGYSRKWLADKAFDDLNIPLYIIATDLISGEQVVFERGSVAEAVRASMSIIGILEAAYVSKRFVIDGGSVHPGPTQLLTDKGNSILASNVIPSLEGRIHRRELRREGRLPHVVGILIGAMEIMESEIIRSRTGPVDVSIQPDIARYGTLDYEKVRELIQRGEEAARAQIPAIKQLLAPHPRQPLRAR